MSNFFYGLPNAPVFGNVGRDAEVRNLEFKNGLRKVVSFPLAVSYRYKKDDEQIEKTVWYDCTKIMDVDFSSSYEDIKKGDHVSIYGTPRGNSYIPDEAIDQFAQDGDVKALKKSVIQQVSFLVKDFKVHKKESK